MRYTYAEACWTMVVHWCPSAPSLCAHDQRLDVLRALCLMCVDGGEERAEVMKKVAGVKPRLRVDVRA
jgi:hypothetical protein